MEKEPHSGGERESLVKLLGNCNTPHYIILLQRSDERRISDDPTNKCNHDNLLFHTNNPRATLDYCNSGFNREYYLSEGVSWKLGACLSLDCQSGGDAAIFEQMGEKFVANSRGYLSYLSKMKSVADLDGRFVINFNNVVDTGLEVEHHRCRRVRHMVEKMET